LSGRSNANHDADASATATAATATTGPSPRVVIHNPIAGLTRIVMLGTKLWIRYTPYEIVPT
jgi:hypothetical protein